MPEAVTGQQPNGTDDGVVAAAAVTVIPVPVVRRAVTVKRDANADAMLVEKLTELLIKENPVGLHVNVESAAVAERALKFDQDRAQPSHSGE
jgi:hypothetical protein